METMKLNAHTAGYIDQTEIRKVNVTMYTEFDNTPKTTWTSSLPP